MEVELAGEGSKCLHCSKTHAVMTLKSITTRPETFSNSTLTHWLCKESFIIFLNQVRLLGTQSRSLVPFEGAQTKLQGRELQWLQRTWDRRLYQMCAFLGRYNQLSFYCTNATRQRCHRCHRWGVEGTDGKGVPLGASRSMMLFSSLENCCPWSGWLPASPPGSCLPPLPRILPLFSGRAWPGTWEPKSSPGLWLAEWLFNVQAAFSRTNPALCFSWSCIEQPLSLEKDLAPSKAWVEEKGWNDGSFGAMSSGAVASVWSRGNNSLHEPFAQEPGD